MNSILYISSGGRPGGSSTGTGIDLGRGGGREAAGTSIETIRGVYAGTEA